MRTMTGTMAATRTTETGRGLSRSISMHRACSTKGGLLLIVLAPVGFVAGLTGCSREPPSAAPNAEAQSGQRVPVPEPGRVVDLTQQQREGAEQAAIRAGYEREASENPRIGEVMSLNFKNNPTCQGMRTQLMQFARQPSIRDDQWEPYFQRFSATAVQIGCL